jgi:hypothetical protein
MRERNASQSGLKGLVITSMFGMLSACSSDPIPSDSCRTYGTQIEVSDYSEAEPVVSTVDCQWRKGDSTLVCDHTHPLLPIETVYASQADFVKEQQVFGTTTRLVERYSSGVSAAYTYGDDGAVERIFQSVESIPIKDIVFDEYNAKLAPTHGTESIGSSTISIDVQIRYSTAQATIEMTETYEDTGDTINTVSRYDDDFNLLSMIVITEGVFNFVIGDSHLEFKLLETDTLCLSD